MFLKTVLAGHINEIKGQLIGSLIIQTRNIIQKVKPGKQITSYLIIISTVVCYSVLHLKFVFTINAFQYISFWKITTCHFPSVFLQYVVTEESSFK